MKNNVTQNDIAKKLNISRATVARALSGKNVSEKTKEEVLKVAKDLGYTPNIAAGILAKKQNINIYCFLIGTIDEGYIEQMLMGFDEVLKRWNGFNFDIHVLVTDINSSGDKINEQLDQFYDIVKNHKPDGIIISPLSQQNLDIVVSYCKKEDIPIMSLDTTYEYSDLCHIGTDYFNFGETTAAFLCSLSNYRGKILTISYDEGFNLENSRMKGFFSKILEYKDIEYYNINVSSINIESYYYVLEKHLFSYKPDIIYAPYKMDYVIKSIESLDDPKNYIMVSNGINSDIENYLNEDIIKGIITNNPLKLGALAAENFFRFFYRPLEFVNERINIGTEIFIKENYSKYKFLY